MIDDDILWHNPANPSERAQSHEHQAGEKVPDATSDHNNHEEAHTGHTPAISRGI
jgi:hypothetical protein